MTRAAAVLTLLLALAVRAEQPPISFSVQPGGAVAAALPAAVLQDATVRKQLGSGLTTTFLVVIRERDSKELRAARLEVRYDLWDEVWLVRRIELDRKIDAQRLTSSEALEKWWRTPLQVLTTNRNRVTLQVELTVLPFSAAEEEDARQWIAKSGGVGASPSGSGFVDALIGTTLSAKPITTFRWNVDLSLK
ncbi:MAG TPA: hypothetical protein VHW00_15075 [Thermoanaerobaculia bacterium]|nr:hypothetical protein [Thermoanaerobaculia bacterium]